MVPRLARTCPICCLPGVMYMSKHLERKHKLCSAERKPGLTMSNTSSVGQNEFQDEAPHLKTEKLLVEFYLDHFENLHTK